MKRRVEVWAGKRGINRGRKEGHMQEKKTCDEFYKVMKAREFLRED